MNLHCNVGLWQAYLDVVLKFLLFHTENTEACTEDRQKTETHVLPRHTLTPTLTTLTALGVFPSVPNELQTVGPKKLIHEIDTSLKIFLMIWVSKATDFARAFNYARTML